MRTMIAALERAVDAMGDELGCRNAENYGPVAQELFVAARDLVVALDAEDRAVLDEAEKDEDQ